MNKSWADVIVKIEISGEIIRELCEVAEGAFQRLGSAMTRDEVERMPEYQEYLNAIGLIKQLED